MMDSYLALQDLMSNPQFSNVFLLHLRQCVMTELMTVIAQRRFCTVLRRYDRAHQRRLRAYYSINTWCLPTAVKVRTTAAMPEIFPDFCQDASTVSASLFP